MKKLYLLVLLVFSFYYTNYAQVDKEKFFNRVSTIYHNFSGDEIKNFSMSITSDFFETQTKEDINNEKYFPIQFFWMTPDKIFFVKNKMPEGTDSTRFSTIYQYQKDIEDALKGILIDWQRFIGGNILNDLPEKFSFSSVNDTVHIEFDRNDNNIPIHYKFYFGVNALCFKIETNYINDNQKVITYPSFALVENKWLCNEWTVQIIQNNEIDSGFKVFLKSMKAEGKWFPVQVKIVIQTRKKLNETFVRIYKFRNLDYNRDIKILKN